MEKKQQFNISYILMAILGVLILQNLLMAQFKPRVIPYSEFIQAVMDDRVKEISIGTTAIHGKMKDAAGDEILFKTVRVDNDLAAKLTEHEVKYSGEVENTFFKTLFSWLIPISIFYFIWFFLMRRMQAGAAGMMTLGKNKAKLIGENDIETRFADVAGADEAKEELHRNCQFSHGAGAFPEPGRAHAQGDSAGGPAGNRQDPAGPGGGR
jgi:cell division protease FtsH